MDSRMLRSVNNDGGVARRRVGRLVNKPFIEPNENVPVLLPATNWLSWSRS